MSIKFFENIKENDVAGGKGISLAKMYQNKFNIPNGYVIMTDSFNKFLSENGIKENVQQIINNCDIDNEKNIEENSNKIVQTISEYDIPNAIKDEIMNAYQQLNCKYVAVRSSATSEDGKSHAWAGQLETFLNVNETNIIECIKKCWSSIFSPRALFYRIKNNDTSEIEVAVVVQKMIQSQVSGVAFSINPTNNNLDEIVIEGVLGLGEAIVSGNVTPDTYLIDKEKCKIKSKEIREQKTKLVKENETNKWITIQNGNLQKLEDKTILELSKLIKKLKNFIVFQ